MILFILLTDSSCVCPQSWHVVRCPSGSCLKLWVVLSHLLSRSHGSLLSFSSAPVSSAGALSSRPAGFSRLHTASLMGETKHSENNTHYHFLHSMMAIWLMWVCNMFTHSEATNIQRLSVFLGKSAINDTDADREQSFTVEKLIIHKEYNESNLNNDIGTHNCSVWVSKELCVCFVCRTNRCVCLCISALLKIKSSSGGCAVKTASARTVCLPPSHTQLPAGFQCSIAGFGRERYCMYSRTSNL